MKTHQRCVRREHYRFLGAFDTADGRRFLEWEKRLPGDSRVEQVLCSADWFYRQMLRA